MIHVSADVIETKGGMWRAHAIPSDPTLLEIKSNSVFWRISDAWKDAKRLREITIAGYQAAGYSVEITA